MHRYRLNLVGDMRFIRSDGEVVTPTSKKARALLAMLAVSPHGSRGRRWLQSQLWSNRGENEASASMRQCLTGIRRQLADDHDLLIAEKQVIRLDLTRIDIDVRAANFGATFSMVTEHDLPEFLEALEISDPEFTNWVRDQRLYWEDRIREAIASQGHAREVAGADGAGDAAGLQGAAPRQSNRHRPTVSVMPLKILRPGDDTIISEIFAYELVEQLSRVRWLSTTAHSSCFSDRLRGLPVDQFGAALGADYIVAGRLHCEDNRYVLQLELVEAATSLAAWSNIFFLPADKIETEIAALTKQIAGNIGGRISHAEQSRAKPGLVARTDEVRSLIWSGRWHLNRLRAEDADKAEACFRRVLVLDPYNVEAHVQLAWCKLWTAWARRGSIEEIIEGRELGRIALSLDGTDARGFWILGTAETWLRNTEVAREAIREAIRLCPSMALAHAQLGSCFILSGQPARALDPLATATKLSPEDQHLFYFHGETAMALWLLDRHEEAIRVADLALLRRPSYWYAQLVRLLAFNAMKDKPMAKSARDALLRVRPQLKAADIEWLPFSDAQMNQTIIARSGLFK